MSLLVLPGGCGPAVKAPPPGPAPAAASAPAPITPPRDEVPAAGNAPSPDKPVELRIKELVVDPGKTVRIKGVIASVVGMRLVPPKVIFKVTDSSETVTVVINEQLTLKEGTEIELVGKYVNVPAPMHAGPGEAPREAVFVVERYLDQR